MIYRAARILLEIVGVAVGGVLVVVAFGIWRLSVAPVEARFIRPYLEQAINDAHLGFAVQLTDARIEWHRFRPVLGVHFHDVSVLGQGGKEVGAFSDGVLGLSARDLAFGRISVVSIDIRQPKITIVRDKDDNFALRIGQPDAGGADADFGAIVRGFIEQPSDQGQFGRLRRIHLVEGRVLVDDQRLGVTWTAPKVDIELGRDAVGATAKIDVSLDLSHETARLQGQARYDRTGGHTDLLLNIANFDASAAAPLALVLAPMAALAVPVGGQVHAVIDRNGNLLSGDADLAGSQGRLVLPPYYPDPLALRSMGLKAHFGPSPAPQKGLQRLTLDALSVDLGDARLTVAGSTTFDGPAMAIDANVDVSGIPLARFGTVWPHGMAAGGREWVTEHIPEGMIKSGSVRLVGSGRADDMENFQLTTVDGAFDYTGMEVHYFPTLPPIRGINGHATFDADRMDLSLDSGMLADNAVSKGLAAITGLSRELQAIDIGLSLQGSLKSFLTVLDMKPLGYARDMGLAPDKVGGKVNMRANFAFPLTRDLLFSQIALTAKGTLEGVAAPAVVGPRDVSDGMLAMALDKNGMTLAGTARLAGVPLSFDWHEYFQASAKVRSHIAFKADQDDADRSALALVLPELLTVKGKIAVKGDVTIDRQHNTTVDAVADIKTADIAIPKFGLRKPPGEAGTADISFVFNGDALRHLPRLKIASTSLNLSGSVDLAQDGTFQHAVLSTLASPRNNLALTADVSPSDPHSYKIAVNGAQFDATPLLADKATGDAPTHTPHLDLTVALDHVLTGPDAKLDQVSGTLSLSGGRLDRADIKARAGGPLTLSYIPNGNSIALSLVAADAGAALADFGLTRGVRGGRLRMDGITSTAKEPWLTTGKLELLDFRMTDAPVAARLVNAVSPTGFVDLVSGQGLGFDRLTTDMDYGDGKITFRDGRSAGALGISFEGDVDRNRDRIALKGTIVPADTFNRIIAAIPLIGDALTGGNRGGFIGWTYTVSGKPDDPDVSVNPLSMFAPGFLRNLFFLGPSEPEPKSEPAAPNAGKTTEP